MIFSPHDILHKLITVLMYTMTIINLKIAAFLELKVLGALLPTHIPEQSINASVN